MFHAKLLTAATPRAKGLVVSFYIGESTQEVAENLSRSTKLGPFFVEEDPQMDGQDSYGFIISQHPINAREIWDSLPGEDVYEEWQEAWKPEWEGFFFDHRDLDDAINGLKRCFKAMGFLVRMSSDGYVMDVYKNINTKDPNKILELSDEELLLRKKKKRVT